MPTPSISICIINFLFGYRPYQPVFRRFLLALCFGLLLVVLEGPCDAGLELGLPHAEHTVCGAFSSAISLPPCKERKEISLCLCLVLGGQVCSGTTAVSEAGTPLLDSDIVFFQKPIVLYGPFCVVSRIDNDFLCSNLGTGSKRKMITWEMLAP